MGATAGSGRLDGVPGARLLGRLARHAVHLHFRLHPVHHRQLLHLLSRHQAAALPRTGDDADRLLHRRRCAREATRHRQAAETEAAPADPRTLLHRGEGFAAVGGGDRRPSLDLRLVARPVQSPDVRRVPEGPQGELQVRARHVALHPLDVRHGLRLLLRIVHRSAKGSAPTRRPLVPAQPQRSRLLPDPGESRQAPSKSFFSNFWFSRK